MTSLSKKCNKIVESLLGEYSPEKNDGKIIHDPLFGTQYYYPHEIAILDCPLLQRLRRIKQMGCCQMLYPGAQHTRFDHTLGVIDIVERICRTVSDRRVKKNSYVLRLAALLHDIGHCPFSHDFEELLYNIDCIREIMREKFHNEAKPHEIISYYIVNSKAFQDFLGDVERMFNVELERNNVAELIVGRPPSGDYNKMWMARMINGIIDADKLDYLRRDGYYTGLPIGLDLDRLLYSLELMHDKSIVIKDCEEEGIDIVPNQRAIPAIEQVLFNKIYLFSTVYHHHKSRSSTQMLINSIYKTNLFNSFCHNPFEMLKFDDCSLLSELNSCCMSLIEQLKNRKLLKRGIIISELTIKQGSIGEFEDLRYNPEEKEEIENKLKDELKCQDDDLVVIDIPKRPTLREAAQGKIKYFGELRKISDVFRLDLWLQRYNTLKWKAHVFIPSKYQNNFCYKKIKDVLNTELGLDFNDSVAKPFS